MNTGYAGAKVEIPPHSLPARLSEPAVQKSPAKSPIVVFAQGGGASRACQRNQRAAHALNEAGFRTLLFDLLTPSEEHRPDLTLDIPLLSERLNDAVEWLRSHPETAQSPLGLFCTGAAAAAALYVAASRPQAVGAVVCRGGRPDLSDALTEVTAPTLFIVGGMDAPILEINKLALAGMRCEKRLTVIPEAAHLFEEPGAMEAVVEAAKAWFLRHLRRPRNVTQ